jgi:hypothetical protein
MQESTPSKEASRGVRVKGDSEDLVAAVPAPQEKRWLVLVEVGLVGNVEYIVDPKSGGAASIYDAETWSDRSRARNYASMMNRQATEERMIGHVAYVDDQASVRLPNGMLVEQRT